MTRGGQRMMPESFRHPHSVPQNFLIEAARVAPWKGVEDIAMQNDSARLSVRISAALAAHLAHFAQATGRPQSHVVRWLLTCATKESLPAAWFGAAEIERVATGKEPLP